ncbi:MAG: threonine/serine exporter family protein [Humibacillus sp.]|nr:threonine/serine exporter family protein [Humibacillus sp.]MDN5776504.1 threonine/serine exporter family protein [Humibacillus sp.]
MTRWAVRCVLTGAGATLFLTFGLGLASSELMASALAASARAPAFATIVDGRAEATPPPTPASGAKQADTPPSGVADTGPGRTGPTEPEGSVTGTIEPPVGATSVVGTPTATVATPTTLPTPSNTTGSSATTAPAVTPTSIIRPETPAIRSTRSVSVRSLVIALVVLVLSGLTLLRLTRRHPASTEPTSATSATATRAATEGATAATERGRQDPPPTADDDVGDALLLMISAGEALIDSGYDVASVRASLEDIAAVNGLQDAEIIALPTALFVSAQRGSQPSTGAVSTGDRRLRLHQIEELDEVVGLARRGETTPHEARQALLDLRRLPPPFTRPQQLIGQMLSSIALAVLLGGSWLGVGVAAVLGGLVGALLHVGGRVEPKFRVLLTVAATFSVATAVFLLARAGLDIGILPTLVAPLVTLLPGALLTTAVLELATGQMIAGAARLAAGAMQLLLLALGITTAAALVGIPAIDLSEARVGLGPAAPWIAVGVFGVGIVLGQCARAGSLGWILLVLYVAYGAQVIGDALFGGVLSAFVGAAVMTPVAVLVSRQPSGPPTLVSFMPAFWLLVPGALGLVGVTTILDGDTYGLRTLTTTTTTMVAIALGVLVGLAFSTAGLTVRTRRTSPAGQ